jgi:hypothetical protein
MASSNTIAHQPPPTPTAAQGLDGSGRNSNSYDDGYTDGYSYTNGGMTVEDVVASQHHRQLVNVQLVHGDHQGVGCITTSFHLFFCFLDL